jgi:hypothetical protein
LADYGRALQQLGEIVAQLERAANVALRDGAADPDSELALLASLGLAALNQWRGTDGGTSR